MRLTFVIVSAYHKELALKAGKQGPTYVRIARISLTPEQLDELALEGDEEIHEVFVDARPGRRG